MRKYSITDASVIASPCKRKPPPGAGMTVDDSQPTRSATYGTRTMLHNKTYATTLSRQPCRPGFVTRAAARTATSPVAMIPGEYIRAMMNTIGMFEHDTNRSEERRV